MAVELVGLGLTVSDARTGERLVANVHVFGGDDLNFTGGTEGPGRDVGYLFCNVGRGMGRIEISKPGYLTQVIERDFPGATNVNYLLEPAAAHRPTADQIRNFKGAFCIPDALPGIRWGDGKRIWTPAYACYDDAWRAKIRAAVKARGYTHFVYNWCGLPYGNDYPYIPQDVERAKRDLAELLDDGLIPVVALTDDKTGLDLGYALDFMERAKDLLKYCAMFARWEQNETLGVDVWDGEKWVGENTYFCSVLGAKARAIGCLVQPYVHFTPEHGSGGDREPEWWHDVTMAVGVRWESPGTGQRGTIEKGTVRGLLSQDNHWDDPARTAHGLQTTAMRLNPALGQQERLGWPPVDADVVDFEEQTTVLYRGRTEQQGIDFNTAVFNTADSGYPRLTGVSGFCDSGRA